MLDTDTCMAVSSMFASIILADLLQGPAEAVADSNVSNPVGFAPPLHRSERTILRNLAVYSFNLHLEHSPKSRQGLHAAWHSERLILPKPHHDESTILLCVSDILPHPHMAAYEANILHYNRHVTGKRSSESCFKFGAFFMSQSAASRTASEGRTAFQKDWCVCDGLGAQTRESVLQRQHRLHSI